MAFKLGKESRRIMTPENSNILKRKDTPILQRDLEDGVLAEANNDGTIYISNKIKKGSKKWNRAIRHELQHMDDMESGRAAYGDNWVMWEDKIYFRRTIDGEKFIDGPNGRWPEGHKNHPWEEVAIKAENNNNNNNNKT